jgi:hypothetical protein
MADAVCGATNIEGDRCALPAGHALHQDGTGDDWGVRWGYEELDLARKLHEAEATIAALKKAAESEARVRNVERAFYDLTVRERDFERARCLRLEGMLGTVDKMSTR